MTLLILTLWSTGIALLIAVAIYRGRKPAKLIDTNAKAKTAAEAALNAAAVDVKPAFDMHKGDELIRPADLEFEKTIVRDNSGKWLVLKTPNLRYRGLVIRHISTLRESAKTEQKAPTAPFGSMRKHAPHNR